MTTSFKLVRIDTTHHVLHPEFKNHAKLYSVYAYNPSEYTYCCELTPSYWLEPIACHVVPHSLDIEEFLQVLNVDEEWLTEIEYPLEDGIYVHVQNFKDEVDVETHYDIDFTQEENLIFADILEAYNANPIWA